MANWFKKQKKEAASMYQTHARYMGSASFSIWIPLEREEDENLLHQAFQAAQGAVADLSAETGESVQMDLDPTYDFKRVYR